MCFEVVERDRNTVAIHCLQQFINANPARVAEASIRPAPVRAAESN